MKTYRYYLPLYTLSAFVLAIFLLSGCGSEKPSGLVGVWRIEKVVDLETNETSTGFISHYVITPSYLMSIGGAPDRPSIPKNFDMMDCQEIMTQLPAGGAFMKYRVEGNKIIRTTIFAMSAYYHGKTFETQFELVEERLVFRDDHITDEHVREWHMVRVE